MPYPPIIPYEQGMLGVGDGNSLYWEACGNPRGKNALVLHGGPGSGCSDGARRLFDPHQYRVVLFDQRNCGRSRPHAGDMGTDLRHNTTAHLVEDIERLRRHLGIPKWLVFGGSWGATLALAYAQEHPRRVSEIVLTAVTTTRRREINWLYHDVAPLFPEQWARFRAGVPAAQGENMVAAYYRLLRDPDPAVHNRAAREWCAWENALLSVQADARPEPRRLTPSFQLCFARIVTRYFHHAAWLEEGVLLHRAPVLDGIPGILVHGRLDLGAPLETAWELHRAWQGSELWIVDGAGHSSSDPGMPQKLVEATDRFAQAR